MNKEKINKILDLPHGKEILEGFRENELTLAPGGASAKHSYTSIEQEVITAVKILLAE